MRQMSSKIDAKNSPSQVANASMFLERMKEIERQRQGSMTTVRLNKQTFVSCTNPDKIKEYSKVLNIKL